MYMYYIMQGYFLELVSLSFPSLQAWLGALRTVYAVKHHLSLA